MKVEDVVNRVHVACSEDFLRDAHSMVSDAGGSVFRFHLEGVRNDDDIVARAIEVFDIPWPIVGINSLISVGSELYWVQSARQFLVIIDNFEELPSDTLNNLAIAVLNIVDRMRTAGDKYIAAFAASSRTDELVTSLASENAGLARLEHHPWIHDTHPVPVIDHRVDPAADD